MRHGRARRLLPSLLDETLPAPLEADVRAHAGRCGRCARALEELIACHDLLAELPPGLVPLRDGREASRRLGVLARWARPGPAPALGERLGVPAVGALAAAVLLVFALTQMGLVGTSSELPRETTVAAFLPDSQYMPTGLRH